MELMSDEMADLFIELGMCKPLYKLDQLGNRIYSLSTRDRMVMYAEQIADRGFKCPNVTSDIEYLIDHELSLCNREKPLGA